MSSAAWALAGLIGGLTPRRSNISVRDGQRATEKLCVFFEAANSPWRQGIWIRCDRGIEINGETYPGVNLWSDTAPVPTVFTCRTGDGKLHLYKRGTMAMGCGRSRARRRPALSLQRHRLRCRV